MSTRPLDAMMQVAAAAARAAAPVPATPVAKPHNVVDTAAARIFGHLNSRSADMTADLAGAAGNIEAMIFDGTGVPREQTREG